ncbi:MAG: MAPEG family protein [Candidatus Competibacterales bacterium]
MTAAILAALLLYLGQIFLVSLLFLADGPLDERRRLALGNRDEALPLSTRAARARRAVANLGENLLLFLPLALLAVIQGSGDQGTAQLMGWLFVVARVLYVPAYVLGLGVWRGVCYGIGLLATLGLGGIVALG